MPSYILWFVVLIEIISFFSRPLSPRGSSVGEHAGRPLGAEGVRGLRADAWSPPAGIFGFVVGILPLGMTVALYALEFLVAFLQAYVFALLTCIYLNDALHPGH